MVERVGIDRSSIVTDGAEEVLGDCLCPICYCLLRKPRSCAGCRQVFCEKCIQTWLQTRQTCPFRCPVYEDRQCPSEVLSVLSRLKIRCQQNPCGCNRLIPYNQLEEHEQGVDGVGSLIGAKFQRILPLLFNRCKRYVNYGISKLRLAPIGQLFAIHVLVYALLNVIFAYFPILSILFLFTLVTIVSFLRNFSVGVLFAGRTAQIDEQLKTLPFKSLGITFWILFWIYCMPYYITGLVLLLISLLTRKWLVETSLLE